MSPVFVSETGAQLRSGGASQLSHLLGSRPGLRRAKSENISFTETIVQHGKEEDGQLLHLFAIKSQCL